MKMTSINTGKTLKVFGLVATLGALPLLLGLTGCTTGGRHEQSTGERIDDLGTSSRVKDALSDDPLYKFGGVNVDTFKGTVQLSGFVTAREQKDRAGELARSVEGVKSVANNITVKESVHLPTASGNIFAVLLTANKNNQTKTNIMTTLEIKGDWNITKGKLKQKWAKLTDDDLQYAEGKQDELIGRIQKRTGETREAVEKAVKESCSTCCN